MLDKSIAERDAVIEFQRRKIGYISRSISVLGKFGGFENIPRWFKRFEQLVKDLQLTRKKNLILEERLDELDRTFSQDVEVEVSKRTRVLERAFRRKSNELEYVRSHSLSNPSPKGP